MILAADGATALPSAASGLDEAFPALPRSVAAARTAVTAWLRRCGTDERLVGDVALALSDACTNVVVHAYGDEPAEGSFRSPASARATGRASP